MCNINLATTFFQVIGRGFFFILQNKKEATANVSTLS